MITALKGNTYDYVADDYTTYYIKPDYAISNHDNVSLANSFAYLYKPLVNRLRVSLKTTKIENRKQVYFNIVLKKNDASFYISLPGSHHDMFHGKMNTIWSGSEIRESSLSHIPSNTTTAVGELILKDYSFKSLNTATNNLYPLTNMLGIIKSLKDKEEVRVTIAIEPFGRLNWIEKSKNHLEEYKKGNEISADKTLQEKIATGAIDALTIGSNLYIEWNTFVLESVTGLILLDNGNKKDKNNINITLNDNAITTRRLDELSTHSRYKLNAEVLKAKILISASGPNVDINKLNVMSTANAYKDLQADNDFVLNMLSRKLTPSVIDTINSKLVKIGNKCILSDKEIAKLIQLPQKDLQTTYGLISIDTREVDIPKTLQGGKIRIGVALKAGKEMLATFAENINISTLPKVIVGPQGVGKTTVLKRIVKDSYKAGHSNVMIDVIEGCESAEEVSRVVVSKDKVIIRIGTRDYIQALAYTEVSKLITEDMDKWERVRLADLIAEQVEYLIDAVAGEKATDLTIPMMRYLHSACLITFIKPMATLADVFKVLRNHKFREEMVSYAKHSRCFRLDDEIFMDMAELDRRERGKITGTRDDLIIGIVNRIAMLQKSRHIKEMLAAPIDTEQDFSKYIDQGKSVFIMIPQNVIPSQQIRDVIACYFVTRLWLTVQLRESNKNARQCNLIFDEVRIVPTTTKFISNHVTEFRRHRLGTMFTCHYLKQFKNLLVALKSAGASYMILAGTEKENIEMLKEEITPFTIEETMRLKEYTSLNVIKANSSEYARFIAKQMMH